MSQGTTCVWCGVVAGSYERLARHLLKEHRGKPCPKGGLIQVVTGNWRVCRCLCAKCFAVDSQSLFFLDSDCVTKSLAEHLAEVGGLSAHYLAFTLGVPDARAGV